MVNIDKEILINAPIEDVWASWDKFGDIQDFHPGVNKSRLLPESVSTGVGARRQCDLSDGKTTIFEEIVSYSPQDHMTIVLYDGNVPIKRGVVRLEFESVSSNITRIVVHADLEAKYGMIGMLLGPVLKSKFSKTFDQLLSANAKYVEREAA